MSVLTPEPVKTGDAGAEPELLIREARGRQRRRQLTLILLAAGALSSYLLILGGGPDSRSAPLLARPLHLPALGRDGRCPVSTARTVNNSFFGGSALGAGPVRVLLANAHGRVEVGPRSRSGWFGMMTVWFAMPGYDGPFVVRGARLGGRGEIKVQSGGSGSDAGQVPGSGPLVVPAGPTINTYYTRWRPGHLRDPVTGRLVPTLTGYGYRTVPVGTWISSPGCYGLQVDGRGFSETIVFDATQWPVQ